MSINLAMDIAMRSLRTYSSALAVTDHNIANMNDPFYSRQLANISANAPLSEMYGVGQIGTGSTMSAIERMRNIFIDAQIIEEMSNVAKYAAMNESLSVLGALMPEVMGSTSGLQSKIDRFFADWQALADAAATGDLSAIDNARAMLFSNSDALAKNLNSTAAGFKDLQMNLTEDIKTAVDTINNYIIQIHAFNKEIKFALAAGQRPNDMLDKRNEALVKLAEYINIETTAKADGTLIVHVNGQALVNGADSYNKLSTIPGRADTKLEDVALMVNGRQIEMSKYIDGGRLGGLLEMRDQIVKPYKDQLDFLASSLIKTVNKIHRAGGAEETDFFIGFKADTIMVNPALEDVSKINYSLFDDNDLAEIMANLENKVINNSIVTSSSAAAPLNPTQTIKEILGMAPLEPDQNGILLINSFPVQYNTADTLETLINKINNNVSNFSIVYNVHSNEFFMVASDLMTVQEQSSTASSLVATLGWFQVMESAAPINSAPSPTIGKVLATQPWDAETATYVAKYVTNTPADTDSYTAGQMSVYYDNTQYLITWTPGMTPIITANTISMSSPVAAYFDPDAQRYTLSSFSTDPADPMIAAQILPFTINDRQGNMTEVMNMPGVMRFGSIYEAMVGKVTGRLASSESLYEGYKAALEQYQALQAEVTHVNEDQELANAKMYQRAYDASVKLLYILDEMLNILINRTGSPSSSWGD